MKPEKNQVNNSKYAAFNFNLEETALFVIDNTNDDISLVNSAETTRTAINKAVDEKIIEGLNYLIEQMNKNNRWYIRKNDLYGDIFKSLKSCKYDIGNKNILAEKLNKIQIVSNDFLSKNSQNNKDIMLERKGAVMCVAESLKNINNELSIIQKIDNDYNMDTPLDETYFYDDNERVFSNNNEFFNEEFKKQATNNKQDVEKTQTQPEINKQ